jgi:hypothetical protein
MFLFAWALGLGIVGYRWVKAKAPPTPGALLLPSGLFLGLAVIAEYQPARAAATAFAYAVDLAVLLQVVGKDPGQVTGWPPPQDIPPAAILPTGAAGAAQAARQPSASAVQQGESDVEKALGVLKGIVLPGQ